MLRKVVVTLGIMLGLAQVSHAQRSTFFNMNVRPASTSVPTHIQSCSMEGTGTVSSVTATCSSPIGAGHFLYICLSNANGTPMTTTFSGDSGTFTPDITNVIWNGESAIATCVYVPAAGGGETAITAAGSLNYPALTVDEFANVGMLDVSDAGALGDSTSPVSNSITPTTSGDLVIGFVITNGNVSIAPGTGYTMGAGVAAYSANEYRVQSSALAVTATATTGSANNWFAHVVAFKP
jgi:hypothetical protein